MAAGVVPQSSCSLSEQAPPLIISSRAAGRDALPLPAKPRLTGNPSAAWIMRPMCQGPGVQVGRESAVRRASAAAEHRGDPGHQCLFHLLRTDIVDMRVKAAGREDLSLARDHLGAGPNDDGDIRLNVGITGLADPRNAISLES